MRLLLTDLAVFWVWEYLLLLCPFSIPVGAQPLLVLALAAGAAYVPEPVIFMCAVAGAVALLHRFLVTPEVRPMLPRRRAGRVPRL